MAPKRTALREERPVPGEQELCSVEYLTLGYHAFPIAAPVCDDITRIRVEGSSSGNAVPQHHRPVVRPGERSNAAALPSCPAVRPPR